MTSTRKLFISVFLLISLIDCAGMDDVDAPPTPTALPPTCTPTASPYQTPTPYYSPTPTSTPIGDTFLRTFQEGYAQGALETEEGDFLVVGGTRNMTRNNSQDDLQIIKINRQGEVMWRKTIGTEGIDSGMNIIRGHSGYLVTGTLYNTNSLNDDLLVMEIDSDGDILWSQLYGGSGDDKGTIALAIDKGYIIAGSACSFQPDHEQESYIINIETNGDILWQKTYDLGEWEVITGINSTSDGGFVACGNQYLNNSGAGVPHGFCFKIKKNGDLEWCNMLLNFQNGLSLSSIYQLPNGNYFSLGDAYHENEPNCDWDWSGLIMQFDNDGTLTNSDWWYSIDEICDSKRIDDKHFVISGTIPEYSPRDDEMLIGYTCFNLSNQGWIKAYGFNDWQETAYSVARTSDRGFIVAGVSLSDYYRKSKICVAKVDVNGKCDLTTPTPTCTPTPYEGATPTPTPPLRRNDLLVMKCDQQGNEMWTRTFGGSKHEQGYAIKMTDTDDFVITGSTASYGHGGEDIYLLKLTADARVKWSYQFGGLGNEKGVDFLTTDEGGIIILGQQIPWCGYEDRILLLKTDENGIEQWQHSIPSDQQYQSYTGQAIKETSDHGYFIVGQHSGYNIKDILLVKANQDGQVEWKTIINGHDAGEGNDVVVNDTHTYVVAGALAVADNEDMDMVLIKISADGSVLWQQTFDGGQTEWANKVVKRDDGYLIAGITALSKEAWKHSIMLVRTDKDGNKRWMKILENNGNQYFIGDCCLTNDGHYLLAGSVYHIETRENIFLLKIDDYGNEIWSRIIDLQLGSEQAFSIIQTPDNDFILVGHS